MILASILSMLEIWLTRGRNSLERRLTVRTLKLLLSAARSRVRSQITDYRSAEEARIKKYLVAPATKG